MARQNEGILPGIAPWRGMGRTPPPWPAHRVGPTARNLLATPGFSGEVLAALSTTAYLSGKEGEILWVAWNGLPAHRRCVLSSFRASSLCAGQTFFVRGSRLHIGPDLIIELRHAMEWVPAKIESGKTAPLAAVFSVLRQLLATLSVAQSRQGLGQVIPLIAAVAYHRDLPFFSPAPLVSRALDPIMGLITACLQEDMVQIAHTGRELIGLGPGLTPAGDDFLGGLLFSAGSLKKAYPEKFHWKEQPIVDLIEWARIQTNPISHAIFSDLALGHGPEPLHEMIPLLLAGGRPSHLMEGISRLVGIGHTSGWDILAGVLTGMLLTVGKANES